MAAACEFPQEMVVKQLGFVGLTGLDVIYNAVHRAIWDAFNVTRRQEKVLNVQLLTGDYEFPRQRQKRTSYEFYVPKGIVKSAWIRKHLSLLPALVVVFYDLDWDDVAWKEKETECASRVAVFRSSLLGRNSRLAVVLIQKNMPLPPGEDVQAADRAASLCSACELSAKSLFVLPFSDHLHGYVTRLENAFYEISQGYYSNEIRRVKAHKEFLNKSQHQLLYVRHQFKVAYFSELKQDPHAALKHYKQAYSHILEIKLTDINNLEVKVVAGFISYKICRLCFQVSAPLDAISQFRKHIDYFKNRDGQRDLSFEHSAWMAKQFSLFGDLFQEAIKNGLQAIQTQHPGFYYQQAAKHSMVRRQLCKGLCKYSEPVTPDPLEKANNLDYYGQRPWRQGCQANEPPDPSMEQAGILSLQAQELTVDHSWIIIPLLSCAVAQFKEYKSVRMKLYLMVQMGEEYYQAKDYTKALTLLNRVTLYYRNERWWTLLTSILITALRCAYLTANVEDYISTTLELASSHADIQADEKTRIQMNLLRVVTGDSPDVEHGCELTSIEAAKEIWRNGATRKSDIITIDMENLASFIECRAVFENDSFHADESVSLKVYFRSTGAFPVKFSKLSVLFSNPAYNQYTLDSSEQETSQAVNSLSSSSTCEVLYLEPEKVKAFQFSFLPQASDVNNKLEIKQVGLHLGSKTIFRWNGAGLDAFSTTIFNFQHLGKERLPVSCSKDGSIHWETVQPQPIVDIVPRLPKLTLQLKHDPPSLVGEFYKILFEIINTESEKVEDVRVVVKVQRNSEEVTTGQLLSSLPTYSTDNNKENDLINFEVDKMETNDKISRQLFLQNSEVGEICIVAEVTYNISVRIGDDSTPLNCTCLQTDSINVPIISALSVSTRIASMKLASIDEVHFDQAFFLITNLECTSPWPITISSSQLLLGDDFTAMDEEILSQLQRVELAKGDTATECQCLIAPQRSIGAEKVPIGDYTIEWRRTASDPPEMPLVVTRLVLPCISIQSIPFYIKADIPAYACVRTALPVSYTVYNRTSLVQEVEALIEPSDTFMFSGNSQVQFRILPNGMHSLNYSMYPLKPGRLALPKLHISLPRYNMINMDSLAQKMLPTHVFVKPLKAVDGETI